MSNLLSYITVSINLFGFSIAFAPLITIFIIRRLIHFFNNRPNKKCNDDLYKLLYHYRTPLLHSDTNYPQIAQLEDAKKQEVIRKYACSFFGFWIQNLAAISIIYNLNQYISKHDIKLLYKLKFLTLEAHEIRLTEIQNFKLIKRKILFKMLACLVALLIFAFLGAVILTAATSPFMNGQTINKVLMFIMTIGIFTLMLFFQIAFLNLLADSFSKKRYKDLLDKIPKNFQWTYTPVKK